MKTKILLLTFAILMLFSSTVEATVSRFASNALGDSTAASAGDLLATTGGVNGEGYYIDPATLAFPCQDLNDVYDCSPSSNKLMTIDDGSLMLYGPVMVGDNSAVPVGTSLDVEKGGFKFNTLSGDWDAIFNTTSANYGLFVYGATDSVTAIGTVNLGDTTHTTDLVQWDGSGNNITSHVQPMAADVEYFLPSAAPSVATPLPYIASQDISGAWIWSWMAIPATHDAVTISDSATINFTLAGQLISGSVIKQMSVTADASGLKLDGDAATPGNNYFYGTSAAGAKGWRTLPLDADTDNEALCATGAGTTVTNPGAATLITLLGAPKTGTINYVTVYISTWTTVSTTDTVTFTLYVNGGATDTWTTNGGAAAISNSGASVSEAVTAGQSVYITAVSNAAGGLDTIKCSSWTANVSIL